MFLLCSKPVCKIIHNDQCAFSTLVWELEKVELQSKKQIRFTKKVSLVKLTHPTRKARTVIREPIQSNPQAILLPPSQNKKEKGNSTYMSEQTAEGQLTKQLSQNALSRVKRRELQINQYKLH